MLRPALVCVLAVLAVLAVHASRLAALETPLTITGPNGRVVMIDPALGSITCYEVTQSSSNRVGLGKASGNFVADAEMRLKYCPTEREGVPIQALRTGSLNNKPGYGNILGPKSPLLADKPTTKELAAGKAALTERVWQAETAFWKTNPTYDGTVRVALAGQYLAIALPSLHTLMIYQLESDVATLIAWHNWGPELFVQTGYNTPNPIEELNRLPPAQKKQALAALGVEDDSKPDGAAPAPPAPGAGAAEPPTPKSDVWIGAVSNDSFVLVDLPNQRAMLYQIRGKDLCLSSVRNLAFDLILPGLYEGAVKSDPAGERMLEAFVKSRKTQLEQFGLDADLDNVTLLVGQRQGKAAKASPRLHPRYRHRPARPGDRRPHRRPAEGQGGRPVGQKRAQGGAADPAAGAGAGSTPAQGGREGDPQCLQGRTAERGPGPARRGGQEGRGPGQGD